MENKITYENLRTFAYSNDQLIEGTPKGIVLEFYGLGNMTMYPKETSFGREYAEKGIIYIIPYTDPWCWMNAASVRLADEIVSVVSQHYGLGESVKVVSTGKSMGGLGALIYSLYAKITPISCVTNCPVCDLVYHYGEREDLPRTLYSAYASFDGTMEEALVAHSPMHQVEGLPRIPYTIFHCCLDELVNKERHSDRFVEELKRAGHTVSYTEVPHRGHVELSHAAWMQYHAAIQESFD